MNLLAEIVAASQDDRLRMLEEASSLRTRAKMLRAKADDLRNRSFLLLRKTEAANRRYFETADKIFGAQPIPEVEYAHAWQVPTPALNR